jgi:hypothetical protein
LDSNFFGLSLPLAALLLRGRRPHKSVDLIGDRIIDFEVSVCELICRKDTGKLIERTILTRLTKGLEILATWHLHIELNDDVLLECKFKQNCSINSHIVDMYLTGDLAYQAMAPGKELMATWWCMQCKASRSQFMDENSEMWTMDKLVRCGMIESLYVQLCSVYARFICGGNVFCNLL